MQAFILSLLISVGLDLTVILKPYRFHRNSLTLLFSFEKISHYRKHYPPCFACRHCWNEGMECLFNSSDNFVCEYGQTYWWIKYWPISCKNPNFHYLTCKLIHIHFWCKCGNMLLLFKQWELFCFPIRKNSSNLFKFLSV